MFIRGLVACSLLCVMQSIVSIIFESCIFVLKREMVDFASCMKRLVVFFWESLQYF